MHDKKIESDLIVTRNATSRTTPDIHSFNSFGGNTRNTDSAHAYIHVCTHSKFVVFHDYPTVRNIVETHLPLFRALRGRRLHPFGGLMLMAKAWRGTCVTVATQATIIRQSIKTSHGPHEKKPSTWASTPRARFRLPLRADSPTSFSFDIVL